MLEKRAATVVKGKGNAGKLMVLGRKCCGKESRAESTDSMELEFKLI